jgi:hypothetical protein
MRSRFTCRPTKPHAGVAAGGAGVAGQARLWADLRGGACFAIWRGVSSLSASDATAAPATPGSPRSAAIQPKQDLNALISEAGKDFDDYQRLTAAGKLAEAGQKLEALKQVIEKLNAHAK